MSRQLAGFESANRARCRAAAAPHIAAAERERLCDPRDFGLDAEDLRRAADRLYDLDDDRLEPLADVSAFFGLVRSHLRGLADALEAQPTEGDPHA